MQSTGSFQFSRVPKVNIERSQFNRSHGLKTTFDSGYLIPIFLDLALPGDSFNLKMSAFSRMSTPIHPVMDNIFMESFFFAVPIRLLWENWERSNGAQDNPDDPTDFLVPQVNGTAVPTETMWDYFGFPTGVTAGLNVSALPFRAYNLIWNNWFRDQNLQDSVVVNKGDGPDLLTDYNLLRRGKRHDYFTSCLPFPQKGPDVLLPLGDTAVVERVPNAGDWFAFQSGTESQVSTTGVMNFAGSGALEKDAGTNVSLDPRGGLVADLSTATSATINAIRQAFQLQRLFERDARGGTRYIELVKSHFGVTSDDARMQRPEYLGGGSTNINMHMVPQTSGTGTYADTPQGNLSAYGTASWVDHGFVKSFTEHCIVMGFVSVRADLTYQQGINRIWSARTRYDMYWPALSHLGEQAVLNKEIYADGTASDDLVFGYQERFAEYRYKPSQVTGLFRSSDPAGLDTWHLAQDFTAVPLLNSSFIEENPPIDRVVATPSEPQFIFDSYFNLKCARPMPTYSIPGMIDHF